MEDQFQIILGLNREGKRNYFRRNFKFFSAAWRKWNSQFPKRVPVKSARNKSRIGYRRRSNLA